MISAHFQGKPFNITVIQVYAPTSSAEEAEVELFYEDLQDHLELTPKKDVLFIIGDWNAKKKKKRKLWIQLGSKIWFQINCWNKLNFDLYILFKCIIH